MRVTKWRGWRSDIPFEAECTACANAQFKVDESGHTDPRLYTPDRKYYHPLLQDQFDRHFRLVHG